MNERIKVTKVGKHEKFGEWLLVDDGSEKGSFRGTTPQVVNFLSKQIPCEVEIESIEDTEDRKSVITRVKVVSSNAQIQEPKKEFKPANEYQDEKQESIIALTCLKKGADLLIKSDEEINFVNLLKYSELTRSIYDEMMKKRANFPDY